MNETRTAGERVVVIADDADALIGLLPVNPDHVASRRILKASGVAVVRLTLDAGQIMDEHQAAVPVLIQVLTGEAEIEVGSSRARLAAGGLLYLDAGARHAVRARTRTDLLLTLVDGKRSRSRAAGDEAAIVPVSRRPIGDHLVLASGGADSVALGAIMRSHAELSGTLAAHVSRLLDVAVTDDAPALEDARRRLVEWAHSDLSPLFASEAVILYPEVGRVGPQESDLAETLRDGQERISMLLDEAGTQRDPAPLAAATVALRVAVEHQLKTEMERLLPVLAASTRHSLAELWADVERALPRAPRGPANTTVADPAHARPTESVCECGIVNDPELPELDVRAVPHAIRHATVFGALDSLRPREGLVLVAPHDPLPLLAQLRKRSGDRFAVSYLERGPADWRLQLVYRDQDAITR
ncbi:MAG TPA: DUF2249 domain-containing protein [Humibacter sp.]|nr:DUF2249 domain-containing protein [Humibacter sp.]